MYGHSIRVGDNEGPEVSQRVALGAGASDGGIPEAGLQDFLFRYPEALPLAAIDAAYADAVPVCKELATPSGHVDKRACNALGGFANGSRRPEECIDILCGPTRIVD